MSEVKLRLEFAFALLGLKCHFSKLRADIRDIIGLRRGDDSFRTITEKGILGAREAVFRRLANAVEEMRAALVVEIFRWEDFRPSQQALAQIVFQCGPGPGPSNKAVVQPFNITKGRRGNVHPKLLRRGPVAEPHARLTSGGRETTPCPVGAESTGPSGGLC